MESLPYSNFMLAYWHTHKRLRLWPSGTFSGAWKVCGLPGWWRVKNPPANAGNMRDTGSILGQLPADGNGYPLQYPCLENSRDRGAWWATVHWVTQSWTWLGNWAHTWEVHAHLKTHLGNFLAVQRPGCRASTAGAEVWPWLETKTPHAAWCGQKIKNKNTSNHLVEFEMNSLGDSDSKESACNVEDLGSVPRSGRSPGGGHGNPLQHSCLENPRDRGAWQAECTGRQSRTRLSDSAQHRSHVQTTCAFWKCRRWIYVKVK